MSDPTLMPPINSNPCPEDEAPALRAPDADGEPILMPVSQAPALAGCSQATIDRWLRAGKLARYVSGRRVYIDRRELVRLITPVRRS